MLSSPSATELARKRILIVDDNRAFVDWLVESLEPGYEVATAHDGASALMAAREFRPDVCLLDIGLPVFDGYGLARRLRALHGLLPKLRLIAVTGLSREQDRRDSQAAGFDAHLVKPVSLEDLLSALS
jgi:CheY-like chemotaxis protein